HPRVHIKTGLVDAHLYCLKKSISSIRGELVPYLVRKQFSKATNSQAIKDEADDQSQKQKDGSNLNLDLHILSRDEPQLQLAREYSCWNDHRGDMSDAYHGGRLRCYVHIMEQGMCYRVNTLAAYIEANRLVGDLRRLGLGGH
ncbi:hypothetical protein CRUP_029619, partial [Coryphaenoides rupestris]